jgi:hypothetical protein
VAGGVSTDPFRAAAVKQLQRAADEVVTALERLELPVDEEAIGAEVPRLEGSRRRLAIHAARALSLLEQAARHIDRYPLDSVVCALELGAHLEALAGGFADRMRQARGGKERAQSHAAHRDWLLQEAGRLRAAAAPRDLPTIEVARRLKKLHAEQLQDVSLNAIRKRISARAIGPR